MKRRYRTVDVFTDAAFGGNPLAVVLDAEGLSTAQMQAVAAEFNYAETTFVLPPPRAEYDAQVRIFTPRFEMPFAGHPNVGTGFVLARIAAERGEVPMRLLFSELAGDVPIEVLRQGDTIRGARLTAPQAFARGGDVDAAAIAMCLGIGVDDLCRVAHAPTIASVGAGFVFVELASAEALARCGAHEAVHRAVPEVAASNGIFVYLRDAPGHARARMFAPLHGIAEDAATGSASAALAGLLTALDGGRACALTVAQGEQMGRPSTLLAEAHREGDRIVASVGGDCVPMMEGSFRSIGQARPGALPVLQNGDSPCRMW